MAQHLVKACRKGVGPCVFLPPLSTQSSRRYYGHGFLSLTFSSCTETGVPSSPSHSDSCRPDLGLVLRETSNLRPTGHFWSLGLRSPSELRFFSANGGSEEGKKCKNEEAEDDEDLSAEEDGDGEESEVGDEDGDDALQLVSETHTPVFKDCTEEAAYIGYKIVGRIKAGDFDNFKAPKAFAVVQVCTQSFFFKVFADIAFLLQLSGHTAM